ncbi:hypothetical protein F4801DRAFT_344079 [Xylaria longipes]|nr:hypothetical protein F4801DRAFT_344079 [Xylaria longipes]
MRKISAAVEDWRFQSWRQVKAWMMEHNRRQKRSTKALASCRTLISRERKKKGAVPFGIAFKKNLVPVISASEMNTNRQKFLDSVIEAIGTCRLARAFRHRLVRDDELPADISPLIFSPLFLKTYENWVRKVKSAALNRTGSDDSESEWSDWEEDDEASDESGAIRAVDSNALPSIEQENDSEDVPELVTRERPHEPSMPVTSQEPEIRARPVKMSRKARRKAWRKAWRKRRNAGRNDDQHSDSRNRPPLPSTIEYPALQPVPDQVRVQVQIQIQGQGQGQVAERTRARERESGSLFPPAPNIRPFADFTTPAVSEPPDPEIESIFRLGSLLCNISEPNNIASLNKITRKAINDNKQHVANLGPRGKNKSKKTATENPGKTPSTRNSQDATVSTSQAKEAPTPIPIPIPISNTVLPVRETPAILRAENRRQGRKLAKQLVPTKIPSRPAIRKQKSPRAIWRTQGEIRPPEFYSSSTWETGGTGLSDSHNECKEKENKPVGNNNVVRNIPRRGSPSDDELSLPSLEEIYGHLLPSTKGRSTKISQPGTATAQTQIIPAPGLEPFAQQGKSSKKRPMREHTTSFPVSASSPKRIKLPVDVD